MAFVARNQLARIDTYLQNFPAVVLLGVRQCGKSTLAKMTRPDWRYFDLENSRDYDYISADIDFFFRENNGKVIIDEAQELPALLKHIRGVIDADRERNNRFILTGSSSPALIEAVGDSLAGRVGIVELGTLKMNEVLERPLPDFYTIFERELDTECFSILKSLSDREDTIDVIGRFLAGGYPDPALKDDAEYLDDWMESYFQTYVNRDIRKLFPRLDAVMYRRFINMLSELSGTIINKAQVGRSLDVSEVTVRDYLDIAHNTYVWRMIPSYNKSRIKSVTKMPKGVLRDSGLLHYLSNIDSREKLLRSPNFGQNFESFVIEEIIKGLQALRIHGWSYHYYRTKSGIEVDLILDGRFGVLPLEIKAGSSTSIKDVASLRYFVESNDLPVGLVINNDLEVKMLSDRIIQIPVGYI